MVQGATIVIVPHICGSSHITPHDGDQFAHRDPRVHENGIKRNLQKINN